MRNLIQFYSVTPELALISFKKYTQRPDTSAIFRIPRQTILPKSIQPVQQGFCRSLVLIFPMICFGCV